MSCRVLFRVGTVMLPLATVAFAQSSTLSGDSLIGTLPIKLGPQLQIVTATPDPYSVPTDLQRGVTNTSAVLGASVAIQLLSLPTLSPAAGFTWGEDPTTGAVRKRQHGFGPIFAERAETIGRHRFFLGVAVQNYNFQTLGVNQTTASQAIGQGIVARLGANQPTNELIGSRRTSLRISDLPLIFQVQDANGPRGVCACANAPFQTSNPSQVPTWNNLGLIQSDHSDLGVTTSITSALFTYGVTDWFDASLILPMVHTSLFSAFPFATLRNAPPAPPQFQFQSNSAQTAAALASGNDTGLGDLTLRFKARIPFLFESTGIAFATDVRLPTGDELNMHGVGSAGVKPFIIVSQRIGPFTPHLNTGYQWNGKSVLTGNPTTNTKGSFPNQFFYTVGTDIDFRNRLTVAFDILGQRLYGFPVPLLIEDMPTGAYQNASGQVFNGPNLPYLAFWSLFDPSKRNYDDINMVNGSAGFKVPLGNTGLMLTANVLFKLNDTGLRAKAVPLFGISYSR
jgi:hypothetical protein